MKGSLKQSIDGYNNLDEDLKIKALDVQRRLNRILNELGAHKLASRLYVGGTKAWKVALKKTDPDGQEDPDQELTRFSVPVTPVKDMYQVDWTSLEVTWKEKEKHFLKEQPKSDTESVEA